MCINRTFKSPNLLPHMKKLIASILIVLVVCVSFNYPTDCYAYGSRPALAARSALIYNPDNGKVVYSKNMSVKRPVASLTKIMTAIVVLDHLKLAKKVSVSKKASLTQPSKVYLVRGEQYTVQDLLYAMLLNSGNDAAVCLAEAVAGTEWKFVQIMNKKAQMLGARNTRFINASGLPGSGQYSTTHDLARIMKGAMRYNFIRKAMGKKVYTIRRPNGKKIRLRNHNKLLWRYSKKVMGKTGYTHAAGRCFLGYATYGKKKMIVVILNSKNMWGDARSLLDYVFGRDNQQIIRMNRKIHGKNDIKRIQRALMKAGYSPGRIDGVFGVKTLSSVFQFQQRFGLKVDGVVGPKTYGKLKRYI